MMEHKPYKELIGSLVYLSQKTRPEISYAVSILCRAAQNPSPEHWKAAKRVLRYLNESTDFGIEIGQSNGRNKTGSEDENFAYCGSDWAGDRKDRKSTAGFVIFLNGGIVSWSTKKQKYTAFSSTEAKYVALSDCVKQVIFTRQILEELASDCFEKPTTIYENNQSCISWMLNPGKRGKHIEVRYHYTREMAEASN